MNISGRPRIEVEERPSCPFCESSSDFVVKTGFRECKKYGKERKWYCNKCNKSWTQERIARDMIETTLSNITNKDEGYLKLLSVIKNGRPTISDKTNQYTTENSIHSKLQNAALLFLKKSLSKVSREFKLNLARVYYMDIARQGKDKFVAIECGDISSDKQSDFWDFFSQENNELYWLPYNAGRLFKITPVEGSEEQFSEFKKYSKAHK